MMTREQIKKLMAGVAAVMSAMTVEELESAKECAAEISAEISADRGGAQKDVVHSVEITLAI